MDIIPSFLNYETTEEFNDGNSFDDYKLHEGEVQDIIYPEDDRNKSKLYIEYTVYANIRNNGVVVGKPYYNCTLFNLFGSFADNLTWTLRADDKPAFNTNNKNGIGKGSKVLLLCPNGEISSARIIGGIRDSFIEKDNDKDKKDLGHHLNFTFNGINININKDGELLIKYNGKTDLDGKSQADDSVQGTSVQISKNGNISLFTKDNEQFLTIDHENKNINITAKNNLNIKSDKGTLIDDATDKMLKGSTYRRNEQQLNSKLKSYLSALQGITEAVATALNTGTLAGVAAAGAALKPAATIFNQMSNAIDNFESSSNDYLSKNNKIS